MVTAMKSTLASQLHLKQYDYRSAIQQFLELENKKDGTEFLDPWNVANSLMNWSELATLGSYLAGHGEIFSKWSRIAADSVIYYLFGDWREKQKHDDGTIDPDRWFEEQPAMTWITYIEDGLCWASVGGHWELVDKLLKFPQPKIAADDDGKVARGYYLGLAAWWKNPQNLAGIKETKELRGAGSKAYHLLCDAVAAIAAGDKPALEKALDQYIQLFLKRRDHEEQFPINATFLWHVARRKGLKPELPEETAKYIFVPLEEL
jgi:hypothetical protein